jgi:hypothetical protein
MSMVPSMLTGSCWVMVSRPPPADVNAVYVTATRPGVTVRTTAGGSLGPGSSPGTTSMTGARVRFQRTSVAPMTMPGTQNGQPRG